MNKEKNNLIIEHLDKKLSLFTFNMLQNTPKKGWISTIRKSIGMSQSQLAKKMNISRNSIIALEKREMEKKISLGKLEEVGNQLGLELVYGFVPVEASLKNKIEKQARSVAKEIIAKTSKTMSLEDQKNSDERLEKLVKEKTQELIDTLPKHLWN